MSSPSNLYAEKVYSEHPIDLWSLDENVNYISLINENFRNLNNWTIFNGSHQESYLGTEPFLDSYSAKVFGNEPEGRFGTCTLLSEPFTSFSQLDQDLETFSIGLFFYANAFSIESIEIGYQYFDDLTQNTLQQIRRFPIANHQAWSFISETFSFPKNEEVSYQIIIRFSYTAGDPGSEYDMHFNGMSMGQWSEEFQSSSLGVFPEDIPTDISLNGEILKSIESSAYGLSQEKAYYLVENNRLLTKNTGMPLVYGGSNVTRIYPSPQGNPSIVFPGSGMFNEAGKYKEGTIEFWIRISQGNYLERKIFGPISSDSGLYISGPFFILKFGDFLQSYYVGEWSRPMLVNIRFASDTVSMLINGDLVMSQNVNLSSTVLPESVDAEGKSLDWLGFFSYEEIPNFEIDCFSTYSYLVPPVVAKRRFVYGQGVEFPENINRSYSGTSFFVDYQFADYSNNYNYPSIGKWGQGAIDNLSITDSSLSTPAYELPEITLAGKTYEDWISELSAYQVGDSFISLRPSADWNQEEVQGSIFFNKIDPILGSTRGVFVSAKEFFDIEEVMTIFEVFDNESSSSIRADIDQNSVYYIFTDRNGVETQLGSYEKPIKGTSFSVGVSLEKVSKFFGGRVSAMAGRSSSLSLYVASNRLGQKTFSGHMYLIGFMNSKKENDHSDWFNSNGLMKIDEATAQESSQSTPTYGLCLQKFSNNYFLDIKTSSSWQDYVPLSLLGKQVSGLDGDQVYDLDFIQINLGYPAPSQFIEEETSSGSWSYAQLYNEYSIPVQRLYTSLDNELFTGYADYQDLRDRSVKEYSYDTSNSVVKSYVSFQPILGGANSVSSSFFNSQPAPKNGVISPGDEWLTTKYEFVDNMIIYPPIGANFKDLAMVIHLEVNNPRSILMPVKIRSLQLSAQALNMSSPTAIGSRSGTPGYPFVKPGEYFNFKAKNPFSIYKGSSPYLYLTRKSGIELRGDYDPVISRGILIPMNQNRDEDYNVLAFQSAIRYDQDFFPYAPTEIFEIEGKSKRIKIFMVANDPKGRRAKLYAVDGDSGRLENNLIFYWNGKAVKEPTIETKEWGMLGIGLSSPMDIGGTTGFIKVTGPVLMNLISHYESTNLQQVQKISIRPWIRVKESGAIDPEWGFWAAGFLWNGVLIISSQSILGLDPADIYKTYTGTNKYIVDDLQKIQFSSYSYSLLKEPTWQSRTSSPV
jgi:hypothetical protein